MKPFPGLFAGLLLALAARGAELKPIMTTAGAAIVSEDFSGVTIPPTFHPIGIPAAFGIVEGALQIVSQAGQERTPFGIIKVPARDITLAFAAKFTKAGSLFVGIDGHKDSYGGNTHLVRFWLTPERMVWDQKLGGPESKHVVGEAMKKAREAKETLPAPTAEQLADPNFFRTEELAAVPVKFGVDEWHQVLLEINGNELVAQVDGQGVLLATATEADAMKNRISLALTGRGTVLIDKVRITENTRRADWEQVKAKLSPSAAATR